MKILRLAAAAAALLLSLAAGVRPRPRCASALPRIPTFSIRRWRAPMSAASCSRRSATSCSTSTRSSTSCRSSRCRTRPPPTARTVTIKLRPGVKFHDGEPFDAEAAKFSLERHLTMPGSFRKPELAALDQVEVVDPLTIKLVLKAPFSPLIAQLTDRAGMMVSPKAAKEAGDKFGLKPVCAGPYKFVERVQQDRIVVEKFADYWNKDNVHIDRIVYLPIVDSTVRLANLQVRRARPDRARARDRHQGGARRPEAEAVDRARARLPGHRRINVGNGQGARTRSASRPRCARRSSSRSIARRSTRSCSTASSRPATSGSARSIPTTRRTSRCRSATSPRPRRC